MSFQATHKILGLLLPLLTLFVATSAYPSTATWSISASIGEVDSELQPYFSLGDQIAGSMVVEERAACPRLPFSSCNYPNSVKSLILNAGAYSFSGSTPNRNGMIVIKDGSASGDSFELIFATPDRNFPDFGDVTFNNIHMSFSDVSGTALSSTALTLTPPNSSQFGSSELRLFFAKYTSLGDGFQITTPSVVASNLQLILVSAVPEPQSYVLLLAGLCFVGFATRRIKDKGQPYGWRTS